MPSTKPLTFLSGTSYSVNMPSLPWQKITLFNPEVYLSNGFRWSFCGVAHVNVAVSMDATLSFMALCFLLIAWIFRTVYKHRI